MASCGQKLESSYELMRSSVGHGGPEAKMGMRRGGGDGDGGVGEAMVGVGKRCVGGGDGDDDVRERCQGG